ncbi:flagellin hook IN motif-containing protein, partial [Desulfobacterales bacterium HSG17]|nr:flagellin hook IN motif-containing protein [Desulfobacterales bacterium HSG17]
SKMGHVKKGQLKLTGNAGGETQLTIQSSVTGEKLTLNSINIQYDNDRNHSMGALADEVSRYSSVTGIKALAVVESKTNDSIKSGTTGDNFSINGIQIGAVNVIDNDSDNALVTTINGKTAETGISASISNDGRFIFSSTDGRAIKIEGSISDVFGNSSDAMSTYGYLDLTQQGVSQFTIDGIGGEATGGDLRISGDMVTVEDSVLASGSVIDAGSRIAAGSIIGGKARVESIVNSAGTSTRITAGSSLGHGSVIAKGTTLTGMVVISGDIQDNAGTGLTVLDMDMLLSKGSTLKKHSVIGVGTQITSDFTANGTTYKNGDVLTSTVTLDSDIALTQDMVLRYSSNTDHNTKIKAGSTLGSGSTAGASFAIGINRDSTSAASTLVASAAGSTTTSADLYLGANITVQGNFTFKHGTMLADGSSIILDKGAWDGPTLVTTDGVLEKGQTLTLESRYTILGDQVLSEDLISYSISTASQTINAGSILAVGFKMTDLDGGLTDNTNFRVAALDDASISEDMILGIGSTLQAGSTMMSGSKLGANTYVDGGVDSNGNSVDVNILEHTVLRAGSTLEDGSTLAKGSSIGGRASVQSNFDLNSDMTIRSGSFLASGT